MEKITIEQIESITFNVMSMEGSYKLKRVEVNHPMQNVANLIRIDNNYYERKYVMPLSQGTPAKETISDFNKSFFKKLFNY